VSQAGWGLLLVSGGVLLLCTQLLEGGWLARREIRQVVHYDRIELVNAHERQALLEDLRARTGLNIHRVEVQEIDLVRDAAQLLIYYHANDELAPVRPAAGVGGNGGRLR
jgi:hypothetical protein